MNFRIGRAKRQCFVFVTYFQGEVIAGSDRHLKHRSTSVGQYRVVMLHVQTKGAVWKTFQEGWPIGRLTTRE